MSSKSAIKGGPIALSFSGFISEPAFYAIAFDRDYPHRRVQLPTYPFQRQRYWADIPENGQQQVGSLPQNAQTPLVNLLLKGVTKGGNL